MKQIELMEWAIAGINAEIDKLATARIKGYSLLEAVKRGETNRTTKSIEEIQSVIKTKEKAIDELISKRENLDFDRMMAEHDEQLEDKERRIVAVALNECIKNSNNNLGVYTVEVMQNLLRKIELKPYYERLNKRYDELTQQDYNRILEMQIAEEIEQGEREVEE